MDKGETTPKSETAFVYNPEHFDPDKHLHPNLRHLGDWAREGHPGYRWSKMYKGVRCRISCEDLNAPLFTAEAFYRLADDRWRRKKAEMDAPPRDLRREIIEHSEWADLEEKVRQGEAAQRILLAKDVAAVDDAERALRDKAGGAEAERLLREHGLRYRQQGRLEHFPQEDLAAADEQLGSRARDPGRPIVHLVAKWLDMEAGSCRAGKVVQNRLANNRVVINRLRDWLGADSPIDCLDEQKLLDCHLWISRQVQEGEGAVAYARRILAVAERFIKFCWEHGVLDRLPRNLENRGLSFHDPVRNKLWSETFALLQEHRSQDKEVVLLTKKGKRWIREKTSEDGKYSRSDMVARILEHHIKRAGIDRSPKQLRATAASTLALHPLYKSYAPYFLGHAPGSIAERHYVKPSQEEFFQALDWLRGQLLG